MYNDTDPETGISFEQFAQNFAPGDPRVRTYWENTKRYNAERRKVMDLGDQAAMTAFDQQPYQVWDDPSTLKTFAPKPATIQPSRLAAQESGAIGAASIASQMQANKPSSFAQAAIKKPAPYKVQRGDTLASIAQRNKMSLSQLLKLNPKFKQQAKYQGGRTIFSGTKVNLAPKPAPKKKPSPFSPGQFRMAEERSMQQPAPTLQNPLGR